MAWIVGASTWGFDRRLELFQLFSDMEPGFLDIKANRLVSIVSRPGRPRRLRQFRPFLCSKAESRSRVGDREVLSQLVLVRARTVPLVNLFQLCTNADAKVQVKNRPNKSAEHLPPSWFGLLVRQGRFVAIGPHVRHESVLLDLGRDLDCY
jgi:hypothetical protein